MTFFYNMEQLAELFNQLLHTSDLTQLSVILLVVIVIAWLAKFLKQPLIIGYLLAWVLVWPMFLWLVEVTEDGHSFIELFSHLWISLLLFMVWVDLNINVIKEQWKVALWIWAVQILMSVWLGYLTAFMLWYDITTSLFLAIWLTFSSTIVIVKLLGDKEEDQTVYGKISIWTLIVQDLVVMLVMMWIALRWGDPSTWWVMFLEWIFLIWMVIIFAKHILPYLVTWLAKSEEFLLLIWIGRCLILWTMFQMVGFSFEIGCLLAWMSFATSPYRHQLTSKLKPLRDFFLVLFFIALWLELKRDGILDHTPLLIGSLILVMIVKPVVIYLTSVWYWYTHQVSFKAWTSLGQISEFWFIILTIWLWLWLVQDDSLMSMMVLVGLISITISSYITMRNNGIFTSVQKYLGKEKVASTEELLTEALVHVEVMVFGYGRVGSRLANKFLEDNISHVVIDHNPEQSKELEERNGEYIFADASSIDVWKHMFHKELKMVVSTIKDMEDDLFIIQEVQKYNPDIIIVVVSNRADFALRLYEAWADYVIMPEVLWAKHTTALIEEVGFDVDRFLEEKLGHVQELQV